MALFGGKTKKASATNADKIRRLRAEIQDIDNDIQEVKDQLGRLINSGSRDVKTFAKIRKELAAKNNKLMKERNTLVSKLNSLEARDNAAKLRAKVYGESGGNNIMFNTYTNDEIDEAKLKVYESVRNGVISKEDGNAILCHLSEAVDDYNDRVDQYYAESDDDDEPDDDSEKDGDVDVKALKKKLKDLGENGDLTEDEMNYLIDLM
nr:MAG TPA: hypothetical protein [Caudoviricetes sp.]